jgi:hypothetical protein
MLPYGVVGVALAILPATIIAWLVMTRIAQALTGVATRDLLVHHLPALLYAAAAGFAALAAAAPLRDSGAHPAQTLAVAGLATGLGLVLLAVLFPASLGVHGRWLAEMLTERLRRLRPAPREAR